ncbi:MAG: DNA mismatch repair endonuclease MutL [Candidatus Aminicenantes bacterium]
MRKIIRLSKEIFQKIAAGEVIERPSSVVKELVENSLDAGAHSIKIELAGGGKKLIQVIDDGQGMSPEDAEICFDSHTTSKIKEADDLNRIKTLGFRGEALSSVSAVSKVVLKTSEGKGRQAISIERQGDKPGNIKETAFPKGTSVKVKDLFFNLPVRKKFLASERAELSRTVKHVTKIVLANPGVKFSLKHGERTVFSYPLVQSLKERIYQIYGKERLDNLLPIKAQDDLFRLTGYASLPPSGRRDRRYQMFWLNRRPIKDKTLQAALNQAYRAFLEKDQFPEAYIFLEVPPSEVDVNIHPAKTEVRFIDSKRVFKFLYRTLEQALLKEMGIKEVSFSKQKTEESLSQPSQGDRPIYPPIREQKHPFAQELFTPWGREERKSPQVLGQYLDFYIIAADEKGILIIDQHNAHERVLFEKYKEADSRNKLPRTMSVAPHLIELSPSQEVLFKENQDILEETGFGVDSMGGCAYALKEYPDIFKEDEAEEIFLSILEAVAEGEDAGREIRSKKDKILAAMACKSAIKAGKLLSMDKMSYLVESLFKTSNPSLCPHGRPITVRISKSEIEKGLGRKKG